MVVLGAKKRGVPLSTEWQSMILPRKYASFDVIAVEWRQRSLTTKPRKVIRSKADDHGAGNKQKNNDFSCKKAGVVER